MVATAVRDRPDLVERCLGSVGDSGLSDFDFWAWLDPLDREVGADRLRAWGADVVVLSYRVSDDLPPKHRVHLMRRDAAHRARTGDYDRLLYLDSDVVLSRDFGREFERLWPEVEAHGCGALAMGSYAGYEAKRLVERVPGIGAYVCTHGLGACLAFPVPGDLKAVESADVAPTQSWDTHFSRVVAGSRVLTSAVSYASHAGAGTGMSATAHPGLEFDNLAPDLRRG